MTSFFARLFLASIASLFLAQPAVASDLRYFAITNVRDTSFTVSWLTAGVESGQVRLIGGAIYSDHRGANFSGITHYVSIDGLRTNSVYSFEIVSGNKIYDNRGARWSVKTGVMLSPRTPDWISGYVQNQDGSGVIEAIVSTTIGREQQGYISAPLSVLITPRESGVFHINLGETRSFSDPTSFFAYSIEGDRPMNNNLVIHAIAASGTAAFMLDMADPRLRASDREQSLIVTLSPSIAIPIVANQESASTSKEQLANTEIIWKGFAIVLVLVATSVALLLDSLRHR